MHFPVTELKTVTFNTKVYMKIQGQRIWERECFDEDEISTETAKQFSLPLNVRK
jgi:hypothetical protein